MIYRPILDFKGQKYDAKDCYVIFKKRKALNYWKHFINCTWTINSKVITLSKEKSPKLLWELSHPWNAFFLTTILSHLEDFIRQVCEIVQIMLVT